jgi:N-carbamoylputrescine amidase
MPGGDPVTQVAVIQMAMMDDVHENVGRAGQLVAEAARQGAKLALLPELFSSLYFPARPDAAHFQLASPPDRDEAVQAMRVLSATHGIVLPVSYFERDGDHYYNSVIVFDADGRELGRYRKTHIPEGPGYEEKTFFAPGDTGFQVFDTHAGRVGVGICWDQWFPECARALTLLGADLLVYPTAIGSEPNQPDVDTQAPWRRVMIGHAVANTIPVMASNRVGDEHGQVFYGSSFVCDERGDLLVDMDRTEEGVRTVELDLPAIRERRKWWMLLRDRRPEMYGKLVER